MSQKTSNLDIYIGQSIGMAISLPSAILYFVECLVIVKHWKQFNSSFYKLFLFSAFNNLFMNFVPSFLYARLIRIGWIGQFYLQSPPWLLNFLCFIMYYNYHCENIATICTLVHRITVIANPLHYERQWRLFLPISIFCMFLGPILFTYRILLWPLTIVENGDHSVEIGVNSTALANDRPIITNFTMMLITSLAYLLVNILLNLAVYILYKKKQAKFSLNNDKSSRLLLYAIAIFLAQLLLCLFWLLLTLQTFFKLFPVDFNLYLANQYVWMNDIRTLAFPAWFLLWASAELNERVRKWFPWLPSFRVAQTSNGNEANISRGLGIRRVSVAPIRSMSSSNSMAPAIEGSSDKKQNEIRKMARSKSAFDATGTNGRY